ncbi:MAG: signal peptide peptidase SppA [Bacteroidetes bacterium]|nr:signal peptide peptidase SppA [Bacteroidota bacterium]
MWSFVKRVLVSALGTFIGLGLLALVLVGIVAGISSSEDEPVDLGNTPHILSIDLSSGIAERNESDPVLDLISDSKNQPLGIYQWSLLLKNAAKDPNISGLWLNCGNYSGGWAQAREFRELLKNFKTSGKPIYAHSFLYSEAGLYIASASNVVSINPKGMVEFNGMASQIIMYKGLLDKMGIDVQVFKVGQFKGAVEPFINEELSEPNRAQINQYLSELYKTQIQDMALSRGRDFEEFWALAMSGNTPFPEQARQHGLVDTLEYEDQAKKHFQSQLKGSKDQPEITASDYWKSFDHYHYSADKIVILYADGDIVMGKGSSDQIGDESFVKEIRDLAQNESIKAVVLRINSPGGSSFASDLIAHELAELKRKKPLIVSFSNVSASGGYYISCMADSIFAQPNSITGSIGVFALIPNSSKLYKETLGLSYETVELGQESVIIRPDKPLSPGQQALMQQSVDRIYGDFTQRVSKGRNIPLDSILAWAQGRVYAGTDALQLGLIDGFGGLDRSVLSAQRMAKLKDFQIQEYPVKKSVLELLIEGEMNSSVQSYMWSKLGLDADVLKDATSVQHLFGIQSRLPWSMPN